MIRIVHPGSGSWFFTHPGSRIQGSKRHRIPDPEHLYSFSCMWRGILFLCLAVLRTRGILVRIRIPGSVALINGYGYGSSSY
jgi:hypothetical protein